MPSIAAIALTACLLAPSQGTAYVAPPTTADAAAIYYARIDPELSGDELKAVLHDLVDHHVEFDYAELWRALAYTDADPDRPGNIVLFYTGWSRSADQHGGARGDWNREHTWSKSRGDFGTRPGAGTDLHMMRPTDMRVNSARGNRAFDDGGTLWEDSGCRRDRDSWEPRDAVKGDVARAILYACVRYEDLDLDLELTEEARDQSDKAPAHGVRSTLLRWHAADPPDEAERRRNDRVQQLQGNRNPFVDRPEWVEAVW